MKEILYVGIDVDDNAFHGCAFFHKSGEVIEFKARPHLDGLVKKLSEIQEKHSSYEIHCCYEASYISFTLQRGLVSHGFHCDVISPSSIPRSHGNQVKTDRVDAAKLAQFYASGLLSIITPPDEQTERDRDLLRSREFVLRKLAEVRTHIQSLLRRNGRQFKSETEYCSHWTKVHIGWLDRVAEESTGSLKINLELLIQQLKWLEHTLKEYDQAVDALAETERYQKQIQALTCYRGIKNIFAMVMITEIGDIRRFGHPRRLASWMGLDIREYSSGGKHNRFGITKHGNKYLRTAFVESNQKSYRCSTAGKDVKLRRQKLPPVLVSIAERCQKRLYKKGARMLFAGKHTNKIKVALAREMVGFVWESLREVSSAA